MTESPEEEEMVLSIEQAAEVVPVSVSSLYRIARKGGDASPFTKRAGRWGATRSDLIAWWRSGERGSVPRGSSDPMSPVRRGRPTGGALAKVRELRPKGTQAA